MSDTARVFISALQGDYRYDWQVRIEQGNRGAVEFVSGGESILEAYVRRMLAEQFPDARRVVYEPRRYNRNPMRRPTKATYTAKLRSQYGGMSLRSAQQLWDRAWRKSEEPHPRDVMLREAARKPSYPMTLEESRAEYRKTIRAPLRESKAHVQWRERQEQQLRGMSAREIERALAEPIRYHGNPHRAQRRRNRAVREAAALGRDAGHAAATWVFDGNTTERTYRHVLQGLEDGDPMVLDALPWPNLSGEWADSPTPRSLAEDVGVSPDDTEIVDACAQAWEDAASEAFIHEVERAAREALA